MKLRHHIAILGNTMGFLFGIFFYSVMAGYWLYATITGAVMMVYGNIYGWYLGKVIDKASVDFLVKVFDKFMNVMLQDLQNDRRNNL